MTPHFWTVAEIKALPEFGSDHGWFYGFVQDEFTDDEGDAIEVVLIAEIYPGMGYSTADCPKDEAEWNRMRFDLEQHRPEAHVAASRESQS